MSKENPFEESNKLIRKLMKENELEVMHLEIFLSQECEIVCRDKDEDDKLMDELESLRY